MADDAVSKDVLMYVADFLVDELSQNAAVAADTKQRLRSYLDNLTAFIAARTPNGDVNQAKGSKRKDAGRTDAEMPEPKVPATTAKKPRQRSMHNVFLSYGSHCLPDRIREHKEKYLPHMTNLELMNKYSKSLPRHDLQQFEDDYKHFLDEFNEQLADGKIDMKVLAKRLQKYDQEQGIEMHPVFSGFMKFIEKEAGPQEQPEADTKDDDAEPAGDDTSGAEDEKLPVAKTPPTARGAAKTTKTPTAKAAARAPPKAAAVKKAATGRAAAAAAKAAPAKSKAGKAAKKAPEPAPEVQAEESSSADESSSGDEEEEDDSE